MTRVNLVALAERHIPAVVEACADWRELSAFGLPYWRPRSPAELARKVAASAGPAVASEYHFVIRAGDELIGECSLHSIDWRSRVAQVGICIWQPTHRSRGWGRAAVVDLVDWATGLLGMARLEAWIVSGNHASLQLFTSLGFAHEGTLRGRVLINGQRHDLDVLGLWVGAERPDAVTQPAHAGSVEHG